MKKTFPLQEVIDDLVNTDKSLTSALMKLNYFGRLIKNDELIHYTNNEDYSPWIKTLQFLIVLVFTVVTYESRTSTVDWL